MLQHQQNSNLVLKNIDRWPKFRSRTVIPLAGHTELRRLEKGHTEDHSLMSSCHIETAPESQDQMWWYRCETLLLAERCGRSSIREQASLRSCQEGPLCVSVGAVIDLCAMDSDIEDNSQRNNVLVVVNVTFVCTFLH